MTAATQTHKISHLLIEIISEELHYKSTDTINYDYMKIFVIYLNYVQLKVQNGLENYCGVFFTFIIYVFLNHP